jgi:hypothetical protein
MADFSRPAPQPRSFLADAPVMAVNAGLTLLSRRSSALADYWRCCAQAAEPSDLIGVQMQYWTQLVDDYQDAFAQSVSQLSAAAEAEARTPPRL